MEKEKVLEIKVERMNDEYSAWCITYQNEDIFKRGKFEDKELKVYSKQNLDLIGECLYLRGSNTMFDKSILSIPNGLVSFLKSKVDEVNEKYGIPKRWRANKFESYCYINEYSGVTWCDETNHIVDDKRYVLGNYFKTREEAQSVIKSEEYKKFWATVRAREIGR